MKSAFKLLITLVLAVTPSAALAAKRQPQGIRTFEIPRQLTFRYELQSSPDLTTADSWWEISVRVRVADQGDYMQWLARQNDNQSGTSEPGVLLKKESFTRHKLSREQNRYVEFTVPVSRELLERFRSIKKTPQVVWISSEVRVHAGKSNKDFVNDEVIPHWDLRYFIDKVADVKLALTPKGRLTWSSGKGTPTALPKQS